MGLIKKTICPKCGQEYSVLKAECPYCGARQQKQSARTLQSSDAVRKGTSASARSETNTKWQLIFGLCLIAAVIIAVIILITTTVSGGYVTATPTPSPSETVTPTPSPTPTPTPTPTIESISITYLGQAKTEFTMSSGGTIQLDASIYPLDVQGTTEWSSSKEDILTVDQTGLVTAVGKGWGSVIARCYGKAAECKVWVR